MAIKFMTNEDYETTLDVLSSCARIFEGWMDEEYNILISARDIIIREYESRLDEQAHCESTLEMEKEE